MAQSVALPPPSLRQDLVRSNSLISTASEASTSSRASLRRRSRTRTRRKSLVGDNRNGSGQSSRQDDAPPLPPLNLPGTSDNILIPQVDSPESIQHSQLQIVSAEERLGGSSQKRLTGRARARSSVNLRDVPETRGRETKSENGSVRGLKVRSRGLSVPRNVVFRTTTHSTSSSSQPSPLTPNMPVSDSGIPIEVYGRGRTMFRDSLISNSTATSSSIYPQSTSTSSRSAAESSIFPPSFGDYEEVSSFTPRIVGQDRDKGEMEFDIDDVQYRLKLLVKNSYFLPPAHSKPTPVSLAPPPVPTNNKSAPTGFLGLFGLGKSKSKPVTPVTASPPADPASGPILRTTSDNTTASGRVPPRPQGPHPFSAPHSTLATPFTHPRSNPSSRVVVLREKMEDLEEAAKQAEKDIKSKVDSRKANARQGQTAPLPKQEDYFDPTSMIDPTDAVDLPPPSENYPFAIQASMAHGLGIQDSVGADVLANRLPPSPGMWSTSSGGMGLTPEEDGWRKALLQEAVSHSLHNTSDSSFVSASPPEKVEDLPSFRSEDLDERIASGGEGPEGEDRPVSSTPKRQLALGRPIVDPEQLSQLNPSSEEASLKFSPTKSLHALPTNANPTAGGLSPTRIPWITTLDEPHRAETPALAHALAPPPRRFSSLSQGDPPLSRLVFRDIDYSNTTGETSLQHLRRVASDGALPDGEERAALVLTPPPAAVSRNVSMSTDPLRSATETMPSFTYSSIQASSDSQGHRIDGLIYSEDESSYGTPAGELDEPPRPSISLSVQSAERPSLNISEFGAEHPSPTVSAFQDAVFGSCRTPSPLLRRSHASLADRPSSEALSPSSATAPPHVALPSESNPRHTAMSPPPRASSSLGPTVLPPPPRSPGKPVYRPSTSGSSRSGLSVSSSANDKSHSSTPLPSSPSFHTRNPQQNPDAVSLIESSASSYHSSQTSQISQASPASLASLASLAQSSVDPSSASTSTRHHQSSPSLAERRGHPTSPLSLLHIPSVAYPHAIHSAPAPSSPADFFDRIQSQPNAMDDLETSDDSSSSDEDEDDTSSSHKYGKPLPPEQRTIAMDSQSQSTTHPFSTSQQPQSQPPLHSQTQSRSSSSSSRPPPTQVRIFDKSRPRAISTTSQRTPIMRLGNHSTPQLSPSPGLDKSFPSFDPDFDPRKPIVNIPERGTYFASRKKDGMKPAHFHLPIGGEPLYRRPSINSNRSPTTSGFNVAGPSGSSLTPGRAGPSGLARTASARRPATADAVAGKQSQAIRRESIQRFDGMLMQHIAAEKDTLKRITTNFSQHSRSSQSQMHSHP